MTSTSESTRTLRFDSPAKPPIESGPRGPLTVGVAVVTHCSKRHLAKCLPPLLASKVKPRVMVTNSSSNDGTVEEAERLGAEVLIVPRAHFNHGSTRDEARRRLGTDIFVAMTPDAYATDDHDMLERLIAPIVEGRAEISYGRQIPHDDAGFFASHFRGFNYPSESEVRDVSQLQQHGAYLYFCSDTCTAYLNSEVEAIGGIPSALVSEDALTAAQMLWNGCRIAYVADAVVKHSHNYSLKDEFTRYFDVGIGRVAAAPIVDRYGGNQGRGMRFIRSLLAHTASHRPWLLPYACAIIATKATGYAMGRRAANGPHWFKTMFSGSDFYWNSRDYLERRGFSPGAHNAEKAVPQGS